MKRILFIVALLPFLVKAQSINNQKVRWMQPIYMGSNSVSSANSSSDTGFFFFDRSDSVLYFKYKGAARAIGYAGSIPNVGQQITDSLKALVRLRSSGSGGIQLQNSNGTNVADFGIANTTNGSIAGGWNVGGNSTISGTLGVTQKATFTDSIVGVNVRMTGNSRTEGNWTVVGDGNVQGIFTANSRINVNEDGVGTKNISIRSNFAGIDPAINVTTNNDLLFLTNNTERARLSKTGDFGIGTSSPSTLLDVNGTGRFSGALTATAQGNNIAYTVDSTTISTSNYTLVAGDASKRFYIKNSSTAITVTIPADASVNFPVGTEIIFFQDGTGDITISGASGVTLKSGSSLAKLGEQYAFAGVVKLSANTWGFTGNRK